MTRKQFLAWSAGFAAAAIASAQEREREQERQRPDEKDQRKDGNERKDEHNQYRFRQEDGHQLRQHYSGIEHVDTHNRPRYVRGERLPEDWRRRMHPVPEAVIRELPPPPPGYVFGYFDGYCVVYDPRTGYIEDVIDLTNIR